MNIVNLLLFRWARGKCDLRTKLAFYIVKMLTSHKKGKQAHVGMKPSKNKSQKRKTSTCRDETLKNQPN